MEYITLVPPADEYTAHIKKTNGVATAVRDAVRLQLSRRGIVMGSTVVYKPLAMIVPGERLARDLVDENGQVLLQAGESLDSRHCRRLSVCGIDTVPVEGVDGQALEASRRASVERSLEHLFRHWRSSPGMNHLRALLAHHRREESRQ